MRELYLYPAMDRADDLRRPTAPATAPPAKGHDWTKGLPPRAEFVAGEMRKQVEGGQAGPVRTAEQFGQLWDQMAAKLKAAGGN